MSEANTSLSKIQVKQVYGYDCFIQYAMAWNKLQQLLDLEKATTLKPTVTVSV